MSRIARAINEGRVREVEITPDLARQMLSRDLKARRKARHSRFISEESVSLLVRDMRAGEWESGNYLDSVIINEHGMIEDGYHRLRAVAESGVAIKVLLEAAATE